MKRGKGLAHRSKKREAAYAGDATKEGRRRFVARILRERPACEAGKLIGRYLMRDRLGSTAICELWFRFDACTGDSVDVHEKLARSAGGSIVDDANVLAVCRPCHDWIGNHPKEALALGLRRSRYVGRNPP
jgi:hypothetical protein